MTLFLMWYSTLDFPRYRMKLKSPSLQLVMPFTAFLSLLLPIPVTRSLISCIFSFGTSPNMWRAFRKTESFRLFDPHKILSGVPSE